MSSSSGSTLRLVACVAGIFTFYLYYGIAQERVYKEQADGTRFSSVAFMLLAQCAMNAAFASDQVLTQQTQTYEKQEEPVKIASWIPIAFE